MLVDALVVNVRRQEGVRAMSVLILRINNTGHREVLDAGGRRQNRPEQGRVSFRALCMTATGALKAGLDGLIQ